MSKSIRDILFDEVLHASPNPAVAQCHREGPRLRGPEGHSPSTTLTRSVCRGLQHVLPPHQRARRARVRAVDRHGSRAAPPRAPRCVHWSRSHRSIASTWSASRSGAELGFANLLNMLELGRIPVLTKYAGRRRPRRLGRRVDHTREVQSSFSNAILVGDAEDVIHPTLDTIKAWRKSGKPPRRTASRAGNDSRHVHSSLCGPRIAPTALAHIDHMPPAPANIPKTTVWDLENAPFGAP